MKNTLLSKIVNVAVAGVVLLSATSALAGSDAFTRPKLGKHWVVTAGSLDNREHVMVGKSLSLGYLTASLNDKAASAVVFLGGTDLEYGAVAVGNIAAGNNAFVKIQEQDVTRMFEYGAFYTGNNGAGIFFALASPVPSPAILDVYFRGTTTATMTITSAAGVQTYTYDYVIMFGPGAGLGTYGLIGLDNFVGWESGGQDTANAIPATRCPLPRTCRLCRKWDILGAAISGETGDAGVKLHRGGPLIGGFCE